MQTAHAFRLIETDRSLNQCRVPRRRGPRPVGVKSLVPGRTPRKARRGSPGGLKPLFMAILAAAEWLFLIADVFVRFYFIA